MQLRLPATERALLSSLLPQLLAVIDGEEGVEHLRERLFPAAYIEPEREAEFRRLVGDDLVDQRRAALDDVVTTLDAGRARGRTWLVNLDEDQVQSWLAVLHDLRLVLAQVVGIRTESDWNIDRETAEPAEIVLWHVGALQEELLDLLLGGLDA
ncbi:MAG TPA: DUF2017 family protein [Euzebyales bacterium]|nr:DUF2017 family protein [Euzebyales bacterium]